MLYFGLLTATKKMTGSRMKTIKTIKSSQSVVEIHKDVDCVPPLAAPRALIVSSLTTLVLHVAGSIHNAHVKDILILSSTPSHLIDYYDLELFEF